MVCKNENEQFPCNPNLIPNQFHSYGPKIQRKCDACKEFKVASSKEIQSQSSISKPRKGGIIIVATTTNRIKPQMGDMR
jgi:hypothetical protein